MKQDYESKYLPPTVKQILGVKNRVVADVETTYLRLFTGDDAIAVRNNYESYEVSTGFIKSMHNSNLMSGLAPRLSDILVSKICGKVAIEGHDKTDNDSEDMRTSINNDVSTLKNSFSEARLTRLLKVAYGDSIDTGRGVIFLNFVNGKFQTRTFNCFRCKLKLDQFGEINEALAFINFDQLKANEDWVLAEKRYYKNSQPVSKLIFVKSAYSTEHEKDKVVEIESLKEVPEQVRNKYKDLELYKELPLFKFSTLGVYSIDNTLKNKKMKYSSVPESQFINVQDLIVERDFTETQKLTEQYIGRGRALVPSFMNTQVPDMMSGRSVNGSKLARLVGGAMGNNVIIEQYESKTMDDCKPTSIQFDIRAEQWRTSIAGTVGDICSAFGISLLDLDPRYLQAGQRTDDEINAMTDITAATVQDKRDNNEEIINKMLNQIAECLGVKTPVFIRWSMVSIMNPTKNEDLIAKKLANGTISKKTAIKRSNPDYTDDEVEEEYNRIMEERTATIPDFEDTDNQDE